ncbi:hypothetical protein [Streptomyces sp900116325]
MLAEIGDDRQRFADARGLMAYDRHLSHRTGLWQEIQHHPTLGEE